jgi:hypothetical protein
MMKITDPEPDPLVRGTDTRIRIRTKMSLIRNTVGKDPYPHCSGFLDTDADPQ